MQKQRGTRDGGGSEQRTGARGVLSLDSSQPLQKARQATRAPSRACRRLRRAAHASSARAVTAGLRRPSPPTHAPSSLAAMRFLAATVATGLVSLAAAKPSAAIYEFNSRSSSSRDAPLSVWPEEARLVLAQRLGVGRFYDLDVQSPNDHKLEVLGKLSASDSIFGDEEEGRLLLSIGGLEDSIGMVLGGIGSCG